MRRLRNQRGQGLLELAIVFPIIIGFVIATVAAADHIGLRLAVHWAARHAARAGAVNVQAEPCRIARAAAEQSLAPWRLRSLDVQCRLRMPNGDVRLGEASSHERAARKALFEVLLVAQGRGRAAALAEFPVMYAPN